MSYEFSSTDKSLYLLIHGRVRIRILGTLTSLITEESRKVEEVRKIQKET